jgi:hypothetical protein
LPHAERSGCLVILEHGTEWPTPVFQRTYERDCVIVVTLEPDQSLGLFLAQLGRRFELAGRSGLSIRTVVVACSGNTTLQARLRLLRSIARQLDREREVRFVIVGDPTDGVESGVLLVMADALLEHLRGERVTIQIVSRAASSSDSKRSGCAWRSSATVAFPHSPGRSVMPREPGTPTDSTDASLSRTFQEA